MYERLRKLYQEERLTEAQLKNAVQKKWITEEQMAEIIRGKDEPV